jgi:para-nitrobenzyl esterase
MDSGRGFRLGTAALAAVLTFALEPGASAQAQAQPTLSIDSGRVAGEAAGDINVFRGLPYAAPPVGPLRWRAPQAPAPWPGVRDAARFGPSCPQVGPKDVIDITRYGGAPEPTSEDCLTLNVWSPARPTGRAPVMVWLHGGSGRMGAGSLPYYDGSAFARDGVVLVTVNYRLGHLGAFAHPSLDGAAGKGAPAGNYALMDQIAALRWVRRNIAAFGGDPRNVTIFGESSGGISVMTLAVTPSASGLFQKAIVESGGGWFPPAPDRKAAEANGVAVARAAGAPASATAGQLRALPARAIAAAPQTAVAFTDRSLSPEDLTVALDAGHHLRVPLMIGVNSGEDSLLDYGDGMAKAKAGVKPAQLAALRKLYGPGATDDLAIRNHFRDLLGTTPARWLARRWSRYAPVYLYRFDYVDEALRPGRDRATHGAEIFYVFQTLGRQPFEPPAPSARDSRLAAEMHARWVAFARSGAPNPGGAPYWPPYARQTDRWMVFGPGASSVQTGVLKPQLDWHERRITPLIWLAGLKAGFERLFRL